jgi:hypothetical protein
LAERTGRQNQSERRSSIFAAAIEGERPVRLLILLGTLAIALPFIISGAAIPFGNAVSDRFLERPTQDGKPKYTIPRETPPGEALDAGSLTQWINENSHFATGYATRVIPLDFLYLFFLGGFLAVASTILVDLIRWPIALASIPVWIWCLLPVVYVICDFAEDTIIFIILRSPSGIQGLTMDILACLRAAKILSLALSIGQVLLLCLLSYLPASRSGA